MLKTPIKQPIQDENCLICGNFAKEKRKIESTRIRENNLKELIGKYGGLNVESGIICRNCLRSLETLHQKCTKFYEDCQKNAQRYFGYKRMAASPYEKTSKRITIKSTPQKMSRRIQLFSDENVDKTLNTTDDDLMTLSHLDISLSDDDRLGEEENVSETTPLVDHAYFSTGTNTKKIKKAKTKSLVSSDHDYAISGQPSIKYNPVLKKITDFAKTINQNSNGIGKDKLKKSDLQHLKDLVINENITALIKKILEIDTLKNAILFHLMNEVNETTLRLRSRKHFYVSYLMKKSPEDLKNTDWSGVVSETVEKFPSLFCLFLGMSLQPWEMQSFTKIEKIVPRIGMAYSILLQAKCRESSRIQRLMSVLLFDNICDQKVFDRLQVVGVCLSYSQSLLLVEIIGGHFNDQLVQLVKKNKRFRIIGDNINWTVGVHDHRLDNKTKMMHAFGSAVIAQSIDFGHLSSVSRQHSFVDVPVQAFLPSEQDMLEIKREYSILMLRVALVHIPYFQKFSDIIPDKISEPCSPQMKEKSKVIPLPVLFKNEQYYQDVVEILDFYEQCLNQAYLQAGADLTGTKIHIGGDQLTRERFSGAKTLRAHHQTAEDKFQHLSPITFELFHMHMNYLKMVFKHLYRSESVQDLGTLRSLQDRISRSNVNMNVTSHYDADKDFFISVTDMYIVECLLEFFGMEDVNSTPTNNIPPELNTKEEKEIWLFETIGDAIEKYAFSMQKTSLFGQEIIEVDGTTFTVTLADGKKLTLMKLAHRSVEKEDFVKNYSQRILEFGLLFKNLLDLARLPERNRGIRLLKLAMIYFKSHKNLSKYALEILRLLVHQICLLSEKEANEEFYGLFVNTSGRYDSHIPADKRMEFLVKQVKEHIKHMYANKSETNISNRTRAISGIREISENFDNNSAVIVRSKKHSDKSSTGDEIVILEDLRRIRPFQLQPGRAHHSFPNITQSVVNGLDITHFHEWIETRKMRFAFETGN